MVSENQMADGAVSTRSSDERGTHTYLLTHGERFVEPRGSGEDYKSEGEGMLEE